MNQMKKWILLIVFLSISISIADEAGKGTLTSIGQPVPAFSVVCISGEEYNIEQLRGKVVLINFFATWCVPCMAEMPELEKQIWQRYKNEDFVVISIGREHTTKQLKKFNKKKKFSFPIAADPDRKIYSLFAGQYIPSNYLIDKHGRIFYQSIGFDQDEFGVLIKTIENELK